MIIMRLPLFTHRFILNGLNLERFMNLMQHKEIPLLDIRRQDGRTLVCECYSADLPAISTLADEKGWRMEVLRPLGLSAFVLRMKKRPGIPIGIALMLICVLVLSQFVWRIDIQQAGAYHAEIVSFLQEGGYHSGIPRRRVDAKALESALIYRYPQIAWFHVYVTNVTLVVEVSPGVAMPETISDEPGDVIARQDGIIQSIRVFAGTPAVKAGDVVRKGDVLIHGTERSSDEQLVPVHADGVIMARCWQSCTASIPLYDVRSTETGRETILTRIHTPWFDWPAAAETPDYLASNTYLTHTPVVGAFFPVLLETITCREVSMEYVPRDVQQVQKEAAEAALKLLKNALFGDEIIDKWVDYCMIEDDTLAATVTAERLVDIGEFSSP